MAAAAASAARRAGLFLEGNAVEQRRGLSPRPFKGERGPPLNGAASLAREAAPPAGLAVAARGA